MRIAIFADVHGKVLLPFRMVDAYQNQYGEKIDLILQCGDLGAFPDTTKLDKATIRHANRDRQELGFADNCVEMNKETQLFLDKLNVDMICVRGNHEDHSFIDIEEKKSEHSMFSIDCYNRIFICKSGSYQSFRKDNDELIYMGVGRIGDRKGRLDDRFVQSFEKENINRSLHNPKKLDILISHDVSSEMTSPEFGMDELRPIINQLKPVAHFYGHTGQPYLSERDINGYTQSVKVKELEFDREGMLSEGCMLIFEKNGYNYNLKVADKEFTRQFNQYTWTEI